MRLTSVLANGLCVLLAACGGGGSGSPAAPSTSTLSIVLPSNTMVSGTSMQASATIDGAPASAVLWRAEEPEKVSVTANGMLSATFQGSAVISATSGGIKATALIVVTPSAPIKIMIYSGDKQSANKGATLLEPLCTVVLDAAGNMIKDLVVTYTVATGGGVVAAPTAPATNAQGIAISGGWKLGSTAGKQTVTASHGTLAPVTFEATAQ